MHCERQVKLGGRVIRLGSRALHLGGAWYTVGPLTVLQTLQLFQVLSAFGGIGEEGLEAKLRSLPVPVLRSLVPLLTSQRARQAAPGSTSASPAALHTLLDALAVCNDLGRIGEALKPGAEEGYPLEVFVVSVAKAFGVWPRELMLVPFQELLGVADALGAIAHGGRDPIPEQEQKELASMASSLGWEVN